MYDIFRTRLCTLLVYCSMNASSKQRCEICLDARQYKLVKPCRVYHHTDRPIIFRHVVTSNSCLSCILELHQLWKLRLGSAFWLQCNTLSICKSCLRLFLHLVSILTGRYEVLSLAGGLHRCCQIGLKVRVTLSC